MTTPTPAQAPAQHQNVLALVKKDCVDIVAAKVREFQQNGELALPPDYSPDNAIKAAWLALQATVDKDGLPVLQVCTKDSIANSLLDMVVQGLNPAKKQCYFIAYGKTLVCQRSYFGDMALAKRVRPDCDIYFGVVYQGDEFEYQMERGLKRITKHVQKIGNVKPENIVAAYCVIEDAKGLLCTEVMTIDQIRKSWQQSKTYRADGGGVHQKFPDQMALRTVIRRACKAIVNSSSDNYLLLERVNRADELSAEAEIDADAAANANGEIIDTNATPMTAKPPTAEPPTTTAAAPPQEGDARKKVRQTTLDGPDF